MPEHPDVRQNNSFDCGPAVVLSVCRYWGVPASFNRVVQQVGCTSIDGTDPRSIESFFRNSGFYVCSGSMTIDDLKHSVKLGRSVIALIQYGVGHWVAINKLFRKLVIFQDPWEGLRSEKVDDFDRLWHDVDRFGTVYDHFGISVWR